MLYFPVDVDTQQNDGTDDMMVIYERLVERCHILQTYTKRGRISIHGWIRYGPQFTLGKFHGRHWFPDYYKECWLPLKQEVARHGRTVPEVLRAFLEARKDNTHGEDTGAKAGYIGIY